MTYVEAQNLYDTLCVGKDVYLSYWNHDTEGYLKCYITQLFPKELSFTCVPYGQAQLTHKLYVKTYHNYWYSSYNDLIDNCPNCF